MKVALITWALVSAALSASKPKKFFHKKFDDFLTIIQDAAGDQLVQLTGKYLEFEEFQSTLEYLETADFKKLVYEMEALPEFKILIYFLERHAIDIHYFIDTFDDLLEHIPRVKNMNKRQMNKSIIASGKDFNSFIKDCIDLFPKDKLATFFTCKMQFDEEFKSAIESLKTQKFKCIIRALQHNKFFTSEVQTLNDNGIYVYVLLDLLLAVFGQY